MISLFWSSKEIDIRAFATTHWLWSLLVALVIAGPATAGPLDPNAFALSGSGVFPTLSGSYAINTDGTPTISGPDGSLIYGESYTDPSGHTLAVFDFHSITIGIDQYFSASGGPPLVLLARGDVSISGSIDVSSYGETPGPGASTEGNGDYLYLGAGGGGFGGAGGASGETYVATDYGPPYYGVLITLFPPVAGGGTYGNLANLLQGGSSGSPPDLYYSGGGGGGAIEIGATGTIDLNGGGIFANGGRPFPFLGGGSGGGIFLHGDTVNLRDGGLWATGGRGGDAFFPPRIGPGSTIGGGGGGGGGGRILVEYQSGFSINDPAIIHLEGGPGGQGFMYGPSPGSPGEFRVINVPEPASLWMAAIGMALLSTGHLRTSRRG